MRVPGKSICAFQSARSHKELSTSRSLFSYGPGWEGIQPGIWHHFIFELQPSEAAPHGQACAQGEGKGEKGTLVSAVVTFSGESIRQKIATVKKLLLETEDNSLKKC